MHSTHCCSHCRILPTKVCRALQARPGVSLGQFRQVTFHHVLAIDPDIALCPHAADAHRLPFASLFCRSLGRRLHGVNRAGELRGLQVLPFVAKIIDHLNFHARHPRRALLRRTDEDTAVAVLGDIIFKAQIKIGVFFFSRNPLRAGFASAGE